MPQIAIPDSTDPAAVDLLLARTCAALGQYNVDDLDDLAAARTGAENYRRRVAGERGLCSDPELTAAEVVRRIERRIGELIRQGQRDGRIGTINKPGLRAAKSFISHGILSGGSSDGIYAMVDNVTFAEFESGLADARVDRNLSRPNVVRRTRAHIARPIDNAHHRRAAQVRRLAALGHRAEQIAEEIGSSADRVRRLAKDHGIALADGTVLGRRRRINADRIVIDAISTLEGVAMALRLADVADLDPQHVAGWAASLCHATQAIDQYTKEMTK
jgi:hypothetical protein